MTGYLVAILTFVSLAVLIGFALNVQWGQAGMINFGLAGFYGVGAYTAAILSKQGIDGFTATVAAIATTAAISALVSLATVRLREDYLAITTLAFSELGAAGADERDLADRRHQRHSRYPAAFGRPCRW